MIAAITATLSDLTDYGTASANKGGGLTMPAHARKELGLETPGHWRVLGSPELGIALVLGATRSPRETLEFLLGADDVD
jgi:hypothetical protein